MKDTKPRSSQHVSMLPDYVNQNSVSKEANADFHEDTGLI